MPRLLRACLRGDVATCPQFSLALQLPSHAEEAATELAVTSFVAQIDFSSLYGYSTTVGPRPSNPSPSR